VDKWGFPQGTEALSKALTGVRISYFYKDSFKSGAMLDSAHGG
jgi:hypothetical protein